MKFVEYKKVLVNGKPVDPEWVIHGSFLFDKTNRTLIGLVEEEQNREYYIPDTVVYLTEEEIIQRHLNIHEADPFLKQDYEADPSGQVMVNQSIEEIRAFVEKELNHIKKTKLAGIT